LCLVAASALFDEDLSMLIRRFGLLAGLLVAAVIGGGEANAQHDKVLDLLQIGSTAADVAFQPLEGQEAIKLSELTAEGPVVLVVLRGWPGYQCPICMRQVADLRKHADDFKQLGAKVVLVYPGPADNLDERAREFLRGSALPEPFEFVIDPDYAFTNLYGLRWDAPRETAYPSTFVLDQNRVVRFRKISTSHGDRAKTDDVLEALTLVHAAATAQGLEIPQTR
jgi:thioredoxin-dependent peroxiredoxin